MWAVSRRCAVSDEGPGVTVTEDGGGWANMGMHLRLLCGVLAFALAFIILPGDFSAYAL